MNILECICLIYYLLSFYSTSQRHLKSFCMKIKSKGQLLALKNRSFLFAYLLATNTNGLHKLGKHFTFAFPLLEKCLFAFRSLENINKVLHIVYLTFSINFKRYLLYCVLRRSIGAVEVGYCMHAIISNLIKENYFCTWSFHKQVI